MRAASESGVRHRGPISGLRARILFALAGALALMMVALTLIGSGLFLQADTDPTPGALEALLLHEGREVAQVHALCAAPGGDRLVLRDAEGQIWRCQGTRGWEQAGADASASDSAAQVAVASLEVQPGEGRRRLLALLSLYLLLACGVVFVLGYLLLTHWIVRPLRRLARGAERVASDPERTLQSAYPPTEVGDLARALDRMVEELRDARLRLVERVAQLQEANHALASARSEVARAERLASVGTLAAGVAHEVGNPLSAVSGMMQLLEEEALRPEARDLLERSRTELHRMERIIRELLAYARGAASEPSSASAAEAVDAALSLVAHHPAARGREFRWGGCDPSLRVGMGANALQQVLVNLLLNAAEASEVGQQVEIGVETMAGGEGVVFRVEDAGEGMDAERMQRAFLPFYTTRPPGQGTGLGLAVCERLINEVGGSIELHGVPGEGTRVRVQLPLQEEGSSSPK